MSVTMKSLKVLQAELPLIESELRSKINAQRAEYDTLGVEYREATDPLDKSAIRTLQGISNSRIAMLNSQLSIAQSMPEIIRDKMFGFCQCCGGEIDLKRMNEQPLTTNCSDCKQILEGQRHTHAATSTHAQIR